MSDTPFRYTAELANEIERAWQDRWDQEGVFEAPNPAGPWADPVAVGHRQKLFVLDMFPYPSGVGLHVGHPLGFIGTDVFARFHRMSGKNVLHTLGYDAFGLPAEQYAVQTGQHPRVTTEANITTMRRQLRRLGLGHDPRRSIATTDEAYYRWTQWIFLQIYQSWYDVSANDGRGAARPISELVAQYLSGARQTPDGRPWVALTLAEQARVLDAHRLAYLSDAPVNWCPGLGTVLANEEVTAEGRSERGNFPVFPRNLSQWMLRITAYADRLIEDLDRVDWPERVKLMQRNWIGRSVGAAVRFPVSTNDGEPADLEVFTTRPDTLFGATFMVVAPEHPLVDRLVPEGPWPPGTDPAWTAGAVTPAAAVAAYRASAAAKSELERQGDDKAKTGVFTGAYATNPVNGTLIPIFVADYVLMGYGTGAIMAVPAEDQRDWDFAVAYRLPIIRTVQPPADHPQDRAYTGDGPSINSANDEVSLDGRGKADAIATITSWLEAGGVGRSTVRYKLRDWLFSRQRYWGEPFPIVFDVDGVARPVPDEMLPVHLPEVPDCSPRLFEPDDATSSPEPPLARSEEWVNVELDLGDGLRRYRRETNTMPNWAGSCWYELRYLDPENHEALVDPEVERYWMGPHREPVAGAPVGSSDAGGVDLYVGGVEHAVLHLLYARFWHKVLFDLGYLSSEEPFRKLFNQGYIQAPAFRDDRGQVVPAAEVVQVVGSPAGGSSQDEYTWNGRPVVREFGKMGKSLKNVVTPDEMYEAYGADTFRVYEMSMGPLELSRPWETRAVVGAQRFLQRLWRLVVDETTGQVRLADAGTEPVSGGAGGLAEGPAHPGGRHTMDEATLRVLHRTIAGVRGDYAKLRFNTAIAKLIELTNALTKLDRVPRAGVEPLVLMTAPVAPHLAEELWSRLGHARTLTFEPFPVADPAYVVEDTVTCVLQINGKVRERVEVARGVASDELQAMALAHPRIVELLAGQAVAKVIVRAPSLVNIVAG
ncbi:MAG TPA: leucine--tRNA ligase [Dermatophilaceae bacterium]|nr:leucine--tRNA ligase [Dermatophilaceae bacterium]